MLFYFSGTGNSLQAAKYFAEANNEELVSISAFMNSSKEAFYHKLAKDEIIGFIFPVYAWGPPEMVNEFVKRLKLENYNNNYVFTVVTCGGNIGNTVKIIEKSLGERNIKLNSGFSIIMPNNYIIMGDIDSVEAQTKKLEAAKATLNNINEIIRSRKSDIFILEKGVWPFLMSSVINPLFNKNAIKTNKFYATDNCTGCKKCEKVCNSNTIKFDEHEHKPKWGNKCTQCLACLHYCPVKAIQYGKSTLKKGRYINPNVE